MSQNHSVKILPLICVGLLMFFFQNAVGQTTGPCEIPQGGMGGTGHSPILPSGIGGTGFSATPIGGGLGGTRKVDENTLGLQGVITGFGSICVGKTRILYDDKTTIYQDNAVVSPRQLALGQVVELVAQPSKEGWKADSIHIVYPLQGPITRIQKGSIAVMHQEIKLTDGTSNRALVETLKPGDWVSVSGFQQKSNRWYATRIDSAEGSMKAAITAPISRLKGQNVKIGKTTVYFHDKKILLEKGQRVQMSGSWDGRRLVAKEVRSQKEFRFRDRARTLYLEGFVQKPLRKDSIRIDGYDFPFSQSDQKSLRRHDFVKVRLRNDPSKHGQFRIERMERFDRNQFNRTKPQRLMRFEKSKSESHRRDYNDMRGDRRERHEKVERPRRPERPWKKGKDD